METIRKEVNDSEGRRKGRGKRGEGWREREGGRKEWTEGKQQCIGWRAVGFD